MKSKRQPKVHKYSKHRRKNANPAQTALSVALTFLIAGAIGVVGYSVAKPLLQYDGKVQPDLTYQIEVDGGINGETSQEAIRAGAELLVIGSYLFRQEDKRAAMTAIREQADTIAHV